MRGEPPESMLRARTNEEELMDVIDQLEEILPEVSDIAGRVRPDQFDNTSPCSKFTVRDLFDHMIGGASQFAPQLRGETPDPTTEAEALTDATRPAKLRAALEDILAAAKVPGSFGRTVQLPFGAVPGEVLARFLTVDGMVHAWDIASATGQQYDPGDALAGSVLATAHDLIAPAMRDGETFASEQSVPDDAPAIVRLAAFTGRSVDTTIPRNN